MKKFILSLSLIIICLIQLTAKHVDVQTASTVSKNIFYERASEYYTININQLTPELYFTEMEEGTAVYYIFNISSQVNGYVIVSADDAAFPVIAYSFEGNFNNNLQSPEVKSWLSIRKSEILWIIHTKAEADIEIEKEWHRLQTQSIYRGYRSVSPLITSKWGQGKYYNRNCPQDGSAPSSQDGRTLVGCVAISMGQILRFHQNPTTGSGSHSYYHNTYGTLSANFGMTTYSWSSMPNTISSHNSSVANMLYHCGVSVEMNYGINGSSAYPSDAASAFQNYFGYASTMSKKEKINYSNSSWEGLLKTDLDNGLPLFYYGYGSSGGHAFICDGYQGTSNNHFHFNWGWDGYLDGYFYVSSLNPGTMDFTNNQGAIFGIKPGTTSGAVISLVDAIDIIPDTLIQYKNAEIWVKLANQSSADFTGDYRCAIYSTSGQFVELIDTYNNVSLKKGYYYSNGFSFYKNSISCTPGNYQIVIEYKPSGGSWKLIDKTTYTHPVNVVVKSGSSGYDIRMYDAFDISPTPLVQGDSAKIWLDIANYSSYTFSGDLTVSLFDKSSGQYIETIETITNVSMPKMTHYTNGLFFKTSKITASPGEYLVAIHYRPTSGSWYLVSEGSYNNPVSVKVISKALNPDIYETNNSETTPYAFTPVYKADTSVVLTSGSNIHNSSDVDYYKIDLANGYNYKVKARLYDSYNSGGGNDYTIDAVFTYKHGANWSAFFDDTDANEFTVTNGGTVIFKVNPFFEGALGTYLLDIRIKREQPGKPDLTIINETVSPISVLAGNQVTATCDVKNIGNNVATGSLLRYYLSKDNKLDGSDLDVGSDNIISLAANGIVSAGEIFTIPVSTTAGQWYVLFIADASSQIIESDETNNIASQEITVTKGLPDLTIYNKNVNPGVVEKGNVTAINCVIKNQGVAESPASVIKYYLSTNTIFDGSDIELASDNLLSIAANNTGSSGENLLIPLSFPAGDAYVIIVVDATNLVSESDENNNIDFVSLKIKSNVSLSESSVKNIPLVFPVPSRGPINISTDLKNYTLEIFDVSGKTVYFQKEINGNYQIMPELVNGTYILKIQSEKEIFYHQIMINR